MVVRPEGVVQAAVFAVPTRRQPKHQVVGVPQPAPDLEVVGRSDIGACREGEPRPCKSVGSFATPADPCVEVAAENVGIGVGVPGEDIEETGHLAAAGGSQRAPRTVPRRSVVEVDRAEGDGRACERHVRHDRDPTLALEGKLDGARR